MTSINLQHEITHVIFDFDGVLIDSETQYSLANAKCLEPYNRQFTLEMKCAQMGRKKKEAVSILLQMNDLTDKVDLEEYIALYDKHLDDLLPIAPILPGADQLLDYFHSHDIPLAICTGSDSEEFEIKSRRLTHWLDKIPLRVLSGSDPEVKYGKPHPDPYLVTMKRFANPPASPKHVLVFEDSINGARSAVAAGMTVVMVPQKEFLPVNWIDIRKELEPQLAEILMSLEKFDPTKYGLPEYNL